MNMPSEIGEKLLSATNNPAEYISVPSPEPGIGAIEITGEKCGGRDTKIFAYIGIPEHETGEKVPGIVLVHGGGGHAFPGWVRMWNDRGYAAVAMDNTGYFPSENGWVRRGDSIPDNDGVTTSSGEADEMWMYHAVISAALCGSILRSLPDVDAERVGITGISWGGVITSILIGYDPRFAFAVPVYGSGFLGDAPGNIGRAFRLPDTRKMWLAEERFENVKMPVLWLQWNDDNCFSLKSGWESYLATRGGNAVTRYSAVDGMMHSHSHGWAPEVIGMFADSVTKGAPVMPEITSFSLSDGRISAEVSENGGKITGARLFYLTVPMTRSVHKKYGYTGDFMDQTWNVTGAEISGSSIDLPLPESVCEMYLEVGFTINGKPGVVCRYCG